MLKMVIVMRTDLGMRKGKMIAQGAHAAMLFIIDALHGFYGDGPGFTAHEQEWLYARDKELEEAGWPYGNMAKIVVGIDSESGLLELHQLAAQAGLLSYIVTDAGKTEFGGVPTRTCCAIGPARSEDIDKITGHLKLL